MSGAFSSDESGDESGTSEPAKPSWRPLTILLAIAIVAVVVGATFLVAGDDAFDFWGSEADACAVESAPGTVGSTAVPAVRQHLSDEPILQWRRVEPPVGDLSAYAYSDFHTIDDGRVAVIVEDDGVHRLELTADGVEWEAHPLPRGVGPRRMHISDDRWIIVGRALDASGTGGDGFAFPRVHLSNDRGVTWAEVPLDPGTPPFFEDHYTGTIGLHVAADRMLLVSHIWPVPQFAELIADRGLIDSTDDIEHLGLGTHSVTIWMRSDESDEDSPAIEISHDELELSPRQELLLNRWVTIVTSTEGLTGYVRTYSGDANGLSVTGDFDLDADLVSSVATRDGFMLSLGERQGKSRIFASADGRDWSELEVDPPIRSHFAGAREGATMWAAIFSDGSSSSIASFRCGQAPRTTAVLEGLAMGPPYDPGLSVGAGGLAAIARSELSTDPVWVGWSTDGFAWDWQTAVDAFGFEPLDTGIQIAVGEGFVLASVNGRDVMDQGWFVAETP